MIAGVGNVSSLLKVLRKIIRTVCVTGTLKHVKSSVARAGGIVLRWSSGYGAGR